MVESEKYKVHLAAPKGLEINCDVDFDELQAMRKFDSDDDFFHVTCHVDPSLKLKIQKGEFVDLDKLLPRDKNIGGNPTNEEGAMELVTHDGHTYFTPARDRDTKISSLERWDQAFRIYAAIYTETHPGRASEIWQYVYVIHKAAQSYQWDNIAFYDVTFHHLMAEKPWWSWGKTYLQGWNLAMNDPLPKQPKAGNNPARTINDSASSTKSPNWRDNCCWRFNKGRCDAANCGFDHRCKYCGKWGHGRHNCRKRLAKQSANGSRNGNGNSNGGNSSNK